LGLASSKSVPIVESDDCLTLGLSGLTLATACHGFVFKQQTQTPYFVVGLGKSGLPIDGDAVHCFRTTIWVWKRRTAGKFSPPANAVYADRASINQYTYRRELCIVGCR
jgi:hypothetical protein